MMMYKKLNINFLQRDFKVNQVLP